MNLNLFSMTAYDARQEANVLSLVAGDLIIAGLP